MSTITDRQMEAPIARMLLIGVTVSAALVFFGGILYLRTCSMSTPDYIHFKAEPLPLRNLPAILKKGATLDAEGVIETGLILLIATPVSRVAFCIAGFLRQKDWLYVAVSAGVLFILIYGLIQGGQLWR